MNILKNTDKEKIKSRMKKEWQVRQKPIGIDDIEKWHVKEI